MPVPPNSRKPLKVAENKNRKTSNSSDYSCKQSSCNSRSLALHRLASDSGKRFFWQRGLLGFTGAFWTSTAYEEIKSAKLGVPLGHHHLSDGKR